jgi:putative (di)nucleoside polyphosphate hydrolase
LDKLGYRPGIGAIIINADKKILMFKRIDGKGWQLPQGGLDDDESLQDCCFREVWEETGIAKGKLVLLSATRGFIRHDIPAELNNEWNGQDKKWFLLEFTGTDADIDLEAFDVPEFSAFKWMPAAGAIDEIVWFKKDMIAAAFEELGLL